MSSLSAHERLALRRQAATLSNGEVNARVCEAARAMIAAHDRQCGPDIERAREMWWFWVQVRCDRMSTGEDE